jgi:DNA-binding MarR family transcriptional regulator
LPERHPPRSFSPKAVFGGGKGPRQPDAAGPLGNSRKIGYNGILFLHETFLHETLYHKEIAMNHEDRDYEYRILSALRRVIRSVDIYSKKLHTALGLTTPQLLCLHALAKAERMTLTDLAKNVHLGVSTINGIIDRLEAKHYLARHRSTEDRRKVYLELSPAGREIVARAPSLLQDTLSVALAKLPQAEQITIAESLERVVTLMAVEKIDASPNLFPRDLISNSS